MTLPRWSWFAFPIVAVLLASAWFVLTTRQGKPAIDLLSEFPSAERRSSLPADGAFRLVDATIDGETRRCVFMHASARLTYRLTLPEQATFSAAIAIHPDAWQNRGSDGVLFRFGVSDGTKYTELISQHLNPVVSPEDRRWFPVRADLSAYAGREVQLVLSANASLPGEGNNEEQDWGLWGAPQVLGGR